MIQSPTFLLILNLLCPKSLRLFVGQAMYYGKGHSFKQMTSASVCLSRHFNSLQYLFSEDRQLTVPSETLQSMTSMILKLHTGLFFLNNVFTAFLKRVPILLFLLCRYVEAAIGNKHQCAEQTIKSTEYREL